MKYFVFTTDKLITTDFQACCLCSLRGGALKQTTVNQWAHLTCALSIPDVGFLNRNLRAPISTVDVTLQRRKLVCFPPYNHSLYYLDIHHLTSRLLSIVLLLSNYMLHAIKNTRFNLNQRCRGFNSPMFDSFILNNQ